MVESHKVYKPIENIKGVKIPDPVPPIATIEKGSSLYEFLILRGSLVLASNTATGAGVNPTIYTVPEGYVFFLVSASIGAGLNTDWSADYSWYVYLRSRPFGTPTNILATKINTLAGTQQPHISNMTLSPTIPLAFIEGSIFYVYQQGSQITTEATIQGYLIEKKEIPQFLN